MVNEGAQAKIPWLSVLRMPVKYSFLGPHSISHATNGISYIGAIHG